jgi:hypothetical protein
MIKYWGKHCKTTKFPYEILGFHGGEHEDYCHLGCDNVVERFRCVLEMEAAGSPETSVPFFLSTQHHIPEESNF